MKTSRHDPRRLDVERFARDRAQIEGRWRLAESERFAEFQSDPSVEVAYAAQGSIVEDGLGSAHPVLSVTAGTHVGLTCQRCLEKVDWPLACDRKFRFVRDEAMAAELDPESDDDLLPTTRALNLVALIEDELLMALPIVARHGDCRAPASLTEDLDDSAESSPFAVLRDSGQRSRDRD